MELNLIESCDRLGNDEMYIDFDKIKIEEDKESHSQVVYLEKKLQETLGIMDMKNKTIFDLELNVKEHKSDNRDKQRQYQKDLETSVEK